MRNASWLGLAAALLAGCQSHGSPQQMQAEADALKAAVTPIGARYESWTAAGQADSIAAAFTEQGREMPPDMPAVVGRSAIRAYEARNASMLAAKLTIRPDAFVASGPVGVERGSYTFEGKAKPGAPKGTPPGLIEDGKYLIHWQSVNGQWQIADMMWNPNRPATILHATAPAKKPASHSTAPTHSTTKSKKK